MQRSSLRWGRAAKLAAGTALVFAIREQDRGDYTHHIAVSFSFSLRLSSSDGIDIPSYHLFAHLWPLTNHALSPAFSYSVSHAQTFQLAYVSLFATRFRVHEAPPLTPLG